MLSAVSAAFLAFICLPWLALAARVRRVSSAPLSTFSAGIASQILFYYRASNRIPDLHDRLGVLRLRNPYKDYPGFVYAVMRPHVGPNGVVDYTRMEIKVGITNDLERRMRDYKKCGDGFVWLFSYRSRSVKWIERMVHLTLKAAGAHVRPYRCAGCGHRHREFFFEVAAGGIEGVAQTIEQVMASVGQVGIW
ncbi:hypothetical protein B0H13DRAFT_1870466 [Mycena leptocephala]|nr:hypothetical protein B0H13DRAFT_1870466 [Mycena leptocephala]